MELLRSLPGSRGRRECGILELVQTGSAFVDDCRTEGIFVEGDGEDDAHGECDQELDPEEERVCLDKSTISDDGTDETNGLWV